MLLMHELQTSGTKIV